MNFVGDFGRFIIEYQDQIGIAVKVLLGVIVLVLLIKAFAAGRKKRQLLSQISETVTEINAAVNTLSGKKSDVIYIDNRTTEPERGKVEEPVCTAAQPDAAAEETAAEAAERASEANILRQIAESGETGREKPESETDLPKKFFSRDSGVAKNGRIYTAEELEAQIKE